MGEALQVNVLGSQDSKKLIEIIDDQESLLENKDILNDMLAKSFDAIVNDLRNNSTFMGNLKKLLKAEWIDQNVLTSLKTLAWKVWLVEKNWDWVYEEQEENREQPPVFSLKWTLDHVVEDGSYTWEQNLNEIVRNKPEDESSLNLDQKLYETIKNINTLKSSIDNLPIKDILWDDKKEELGKISELLGKLLIVANCSTVDNVKILQKFIADNIGEGILGEGFDLDSFREATQFDENNGYNWLFWKTTLKYLNGIVTKIDNYIKQLGTWVANKEGVQTTDDSEGKNLGLYKPYEIKNDKWETIQSCPVVENASCNSQWLTVYCKSPLQSGDNNMTSFTVEGNNRLNYEYIMEIKNKPWYYKVKFDAEWNLCPTAENAQSGKKVLLRDVESCRNYLQNAAPKGAIVSWSKGNDNYVIGSNNNNQLLTIEPMTIDWYWVSNNLSECLRLLDFTNFLRSVSEIDDLQVEKNPDLKIENDRLYIKLWEKDRNGNYRYPISENYYSWINDILKMDKDVLNKFKSYNKREEWNDAWTPKNINKDYKKIDIFGGVVKGVDGDSASLLNSGVYTPDYTWEGVDDHKGNVVALRGLLGVELTDSEAIKIKNDFGLQNWVAIFKPSDGNVKGYYFSDWWNIYYVDNNHRNKCLMQADWQKVEQVNVCDKWLYELNSGLNEILNDESVDNSDSQISIKNNEENNGYAFTNGQITIPINDILILNLGEGYNNVNNRLKIIYDLVVGKIKGNKRKVNGDGDILFDDGSPLITKSDLQNSYGIIDEGARNKFVQYLEKVLERGDS